MQRNLSFSHGMTGLFWGLLVALGGLLLPIAEAEAQPIRGDRCDSVYIDARKGDDGCCFSFLVENDLDNIDRIVMTTSGGYDFSDASGPRSADVSFQGTTATWIFDEGVPGRTDDLEACFKPQPNVRTDGTFQVVVHWYNGRTIVCSDTIDLDCREEEPGCAELIGSEAECLMEAGAISFGWYFTIKNQSDFWAKSYTLRPLDQGVTVSPAGGRSDEAIRPGGTFERSKHTISGARPGQVVRFAVEICGSSTADSRDVRCCTVEVRIELPKCEPNEEDCIDIGESSIECVDRTASGEFVYQWCFVFKNTGDFPINHMEVRGQTVQVQTVAPGGTGRACVRIVGEPGPTGVGILVCGITEGGVDTIRGRDGQIIIDSVEGERRCCDMRHELRLPECEDDGCFEIVEQEIECDSAGGYIWCFNVRNNARWAMGSFRLGSPNNVSISPNPIEFDRPVPPGGLSPRICVRITGARPGVLPIYGLNAASQLDVSCSDSLVIRLPECDDPHEGDCCRGFNIGLQTVPPVAGSNGFTGLLGLISAGPAPITKASATITYASVNGQPAYGHMVAGTILNPFGAGTVTPPGLGQEIIWQNANGVNMTNPSFNLNWMRFPPMAPNARTDTLRFCIRWRFTDTECRTCDTLVCYTRVRRRIVFGGNTSGTSFDGKGAVTAGGDEGHIGGSLTGSNAGRLEISFPELDPAEFGTVTFTGLRLQATDGATIVGATSDGNSVPLTVDQGLVTGTFTIGAGGTLAMDLNYDGLDDGARLGHLLILDYESSIEPGVTQQIPLTVTLRRDDLRGGDQVEAVSALVDGRNVATYALHIRNENKTGEALAGLRLSAPENMEFLAVGPTSSTTEATLRFGRAGDEGQAYVSEAAEGTVTLAPGAERKPVYVTVATDPETAPVVNFATLNEFGETISEGEIDLTQVSSVGHTGDATRSVALLGNAAPNPAGTDASLSFSLPRGTEASIVLRDARGREVARLIDGESLDAGDHVVTFSVADLPNGTYFYSLETAEGTETKRMVVQR